MRTCAYFACLRAPPLARFRRARASCISDAFVFDGHVHVIDRQFYHGGDIGERMSDGQFDLPRAKEGGLDAMFFSIFVTEDYYPRRLETKQALRMIDLALTQMEQNRTRSSSRERRRYRADQHSRARSRPCSISKAASISTATSASCATCTAWACARRSSPRTTGPTTSPTPAARPPKWHGLNERGRAVVREMNRLGMVINVSHASDETIAQAIELSTRPGRRDPSRPARRQRHPAQHARGPDAQDRGERRRDRLPDRQRIS